MTSHWTEMSLPSNFSVSQSSHMRRQPAPQQSEIPLFKPPLSAIQESPCLTSVQDVNVLILPTLSAFLLNSFVSILIFALMLAIVAFVLHFLYTESKKLTNAREANRHLKDGNFMNARDTVLYYDRLVRN